MINQRNIRQKQLIKNWNLLVDDLKKINIDFLRAVDDKGLCDGVSKLFLYYQHADPDAFDFFFTFLSILNEKDIHDLAVKIKDYLEKKPGQHLFPISLGKETYSFEKLIAFVIAVDKTQSSQHITRFKSIEAAWDAKHLIVCEDYQLVDFLKRSELMQGKNKLKYVSFTTHAMASAKQLDQSVIYFDSIGQKKTCINEEDFAEVLSRSSFWTGASSINLEFDEISYGNENREFDDLLLQYMPIIELDSYMNSLVKNRYDNGQIPRFDAAYCLYTYLSKSNNSEACNEFKMKLDEFIKLHPEKNLISHKLINKLTPQNNPPLMVACEYGKFRLVKKLVKAGADINLASMMTGMTALMKAANYGHIEIVQFLLSKEADLELVDKYGWTALMNAASNGHIAVVELLLHKGANPNVLNKDGWSALMIGVKEGHIAVVELLLTKGVDPNVATQDGWTTLMMAANDGHIAIVELLLAKGANPNVATQDGCTALMMAANKGGVEIVQLLLSQGADTNTLSKIGWTSLMMAANKGYIEIVQLLLSKGAKIHIEGKSKEGVTSIYLAAEHGHVACVEILLNYGADCNASIKASPQVLLKKAKTVENEAVVEKLLKRNSAILSFWGKIPNVLEGFTPLHAAAFFGHAEVVKLLLAHGADLNSQTEGITAWEFAKAMGHKDIQDILQQKEIHLARSDVELKTISKKV